MPARYRPLPSPALLSMLAALGLLLLSLSLGSVRAQTSHTHTFTAVPQLDCILQPGTSLFYVGSNTASDYQPVPGCVIRLHKDSTGQWIDFDNCINNGGMCDFDDTAAPPGCSVAPRRAPNGLTVDSWSASAGDGAFGYLDANQAFQVTTIWSQVTHYRTPSTPMSVTLTLQLRDVPVATLDNGGQIATPGGETCSSTRTLNVGWGAPGSWSPMPTISGGGISAPALGSTVGWASWVPCSALLARDFDTRSQSGACSQAQLADTLTYTWTAPPGTGFINGQNVGQNVTWYSPSANGTYLLTLTVSDSATKPAGDSGGRDDVDLTYTVAVEVRQATWAVLTAIDPGSPAGIQLPADQKRVAGSQSVTCTAFAAADADRRTAPNGTVTTVADVIKYTWTAMENGQPQGSFTGGNVGQTVTWQAPATGGGEVTLTLTIDDQNDDNKPANEGGTRNDVPNPPLVFTRKLYYHKHSFATTGNTADRPVELRHIDTSVAASGVNAGEILILQPGTITPDQDTCTVPYCPFSVTNCAIPLSTTPTTVTEDVARHQTVAYEDTGGGTFGTFNTTSNTFTALNPTTQVGQVTHYRVNPTLTGGTIQVRAKISAPGIAIDPCAATDVNTAPDPDKLGTPFTAPVAVHDVFPETHRYLDPEDACGCSVCGMPGNSSIDPKSGAVSFQVPASGFEYRGVDLSLAFSYNSNAKADPRLDSPNLPGVDPVGDLARMSQRNSHWTHNWAQALEVIYDGSVEKALWHTGSGGTIAFERTGSGSWVALDTSHSLLSGGSVTTIVRVKETHSSGGGGGTVADERMIQTTLPYSWFELRDGEGTVHRFQDVVWQRGTGASIAYFPLAWTRDRWGRGVDLLWQDGNVKSVTENQTGGGTPKKLTFTYTTSGLLDYVTDATGKNHDLQYSAVLDELAPPVSRQKLTGLVIAGPGPGAVPLVSYQWTFSYGSPGQPGNYTGSYTGDLIIQKTEPGGKTAFYQFAPVNTNRDTAGDWDGAVAQTWYVEGGVTKAIVRNGTQLTYPGGVTYSYTYGGGHDLHEVEEVATGRKVHYRYDALHNLTKMWTDRPGEDEAHPLIELSYVLNPDQSIQRITARDFLGHVTVTNVGAYSLPTSTVQYPTTRTSPAYDKRVTWEYDNLGLPAFGRRNNVTAVRSYTGSAATNTWSEIDGSLVQLAYNVATGSVRPDLPVSSTELGVRTWQFEYDATTGWPTRSLSPPNHVALLGSADASPSVQRVEYGSDGLPFRLTDPLNRQTELTYSQKSYAGNSPHFGKTNHLRVKLLRKWDNEARYVCYDPNGQVTETENELGVRTDYVYNIAGQVTAVYENAQDSAFRVTQYRYDLRGDLVELVPPKGELCKVQYSYERFSQLGVPQGVYEGRVTRIIHPDGTKEYFGYDAATGELNWESRPFASETQYLVTTHERDELHRPSLTTFPADPSNPTSGFTVETHYDDFGRVSSVSRNGASTTYAYDGLDRVTQVLPSDSRRTLQVGYIPDPVNGRWITQTTLSGLPGIWEDYEDTKGRLALTISPVNRQLSNDLYGQAFWLDYDPAGRPVGRRYRESTRTTPWQDIQYTYNDALRQSAIIHRKPNGTVLEQFLNQYDEVGRLTLETDNAGRQHGYSYDNFNQLYNETHPDFPAGGITYEYDPNGNRRKVTQGSAVDWYRVDNADRLLWINRGADAVNDPATSGGSQPFTSYRYDEFGQLTWRQRRVTSGGPKKTFGFLWDADGRLRKAVEGGAEVFSAEYAAGGDRIKKSDSVSGEHLYNFGLHDSNGGGWLYTPGFGHQDGTKVRKYHTDQLGSTRALASPAGDTANSTFRYDAFGQRTNLGGPSTDTYPTEFQFAGAHGYQSEPVTGDGLDLQYLYQRYYDPQAGRFISRDPIRWAGGLNLYGYVGNNPANVVDPLGRKGEKIAFIFIGDTHALNFLQGPANTAGIVTDTVLLWKYFKKEGYSIRYKERVTPNDVTKALGNPAVKAVAFIGHDAFHGAVQLYPNGRGVDKDADFYDPADFAKALGGRKLDHAIFHVCYSDRPDLRDATVGTTGRFEGSKGQWTSFFRADMGSWYWWKGSRQRQYLKQR